MMFQPSSGERVSSFEPDRPGIGSNVMGTSDTAARIPEVGTGRCGLPLTYLSVFTCWRSRAGVHPSTLC